MKQRHLKKLVLVIPLTLILLSGCSNDLSFIIEYDNAAGLKKGDAIVHSDQVIGVIDDIRYTDSGKIQVSVSVQEAYRDLARNTSLFYINEGPDTSDTDNTDIVIELVTRSSDEDSMIEQGQVITGSDKVKGLVQDATNQFSQALQSFSDSIQKSWNEWKDETLDQQIASLEAELDIIIEKAKNLNERNRRYLKEELMPQINRQIEALRQKLKEFNREHELDDVEEKLLEANEYLEA